MPLNGVIWVILTPKSMCFMSDFGIGFYAMDFARFGKVLIQGSSFAHNIDEFGLASRGA